MLKTIRIYAEFYDGELNSAWILQHTELSPSSLVPDGQPSPCWKGVTLLEGDNSACCRIHAEFNSPS